MTEDQLKEVTVFRNDIQLRLSLEEEKLKHMMPNLTVIKEYKQKVRPSTSIMTTSNEKKIFRSNARKSRTFRRKSRPASGNGSKPL